MNKKRLIEIIFSIFVFALNVFGSIYILKVKLNMVCIFFLSLSSVIMVLSHEHLMKNNEIVKFILEFFTGFGVLILVEIYLKVEFTPIIAVAYIGLLLVEITIFSISFLGYIMNSEKRKE